MRFVRLATIAFLLLVLSTPLTAAPAAAAGAASSARTSATLLVSVLSGTCPESRPGAGQLESQIICLDIAFTPTGIPAGESRTITVQLLGHVGNAAPGTLQVFDADYAVFTVDSGANGRLQRPAAGCKFVPGASGELLSHHEFRVVPGPGIALVAGSIVTSASFECPDSGEPGVPPTDAVILADTGGLDLRLLAAGLVLFAAGLVLFLRSRRRRPARP